MPNPETIDLTPDEMDALIKNVEANNLSELDRQRCAKALRFFYWMQDKLERSRITIAQLKSLFGVKTEKKLL